MRQTKSHYIIKKFAIKALVDQQNIHQQVLGFAHKIIIEVTKPSSYRRLQNKQKG
jgi:hypothetical protein